MEKFIIATGKTIDLAVASALEELKLDRDSVSVEVLENPKRGFLGLGGTPAKIKVTYEAPDEPAPKQEPEAPKSALSAASRKPKKSQLPAKQKDEVPTTGAVLKPKNPTPQKAAPAAQPQQPPKAREPKEPKPQRQPKPQPPKAPAEPKEPKEPKVYAPAAPGSTEEQIEKFLKGLLEHMGSDAVPHAVVSEQDKDTYMVELVGEHLGMLIGRRGDTLDAIQHLANYSINRGNSRHVRINVDAENYRQKREESLQRLALKVAGKVAKYRRNITLEPMNAYERHVIHAVLQDEPNVSTYSVGTEPNRRIVVAYGKNRAPKQS